MDQRPIEELARGLGRHAADRVDLDRVAAHVTTRLQSAGRPRRAAAARRWIGVAAVLAFGAGATVMALRTGPASDAGRAVAGAPALDSLSADELVEVLDSLTMQASVSGQFSYGLDDLDAAQLEELLASLEG